MGPWAPGSPTNPFSPLTPLNTIWLGCFDAEDHLRISEVPRLALLPWEPLLPLAASPPRQPMPARAPVPPSLAGQALPAHEPRPPWDPSGTTLPLPSLAPHQAREARLALHSWQGGLLPHHLPLLPLLPLVPLYSIAAPEARWAWPARWPLLARLPLGSPGSGQAEVAMGAREPSPTILALVTRLPALGWGQR